MTSAFSSHPGATLPETHVDTFVSLDIEATGMDPTRHEILEVAAVRVSSTGDSVSFHSLVRPDGGVPLDIFRLTGISSAELAEALPLSEVAGQLTAFIGTDPVVAHSVELDLAMLAGSQILVSNDRYDTYQLATVLFPDLPNYSLSSVAAHLSLPSTTSHRALEDARITGRVFEAMLERLRCYDPSTLDHIASLARQAEWPSASLFARLSHESPPGPLFSPHESRRSGPHELAFLVPRERPDPLQATGSREAISVDEVDAALAPGGAVSEAVAAYEDRPQQRQMATAVARAFNHDEHLLVEAGTGTGKSLAYLLPAVLHAVEHGETVVVSTNTLALQDQLYRKDIPDLREALGRIQEDADFRATQLKGRTNYLCLRRWFSAQKEPVLSPGDAGLRAKVTIWLSETETGDRAELRLDQTEEPSWRHLSAEEHACVASRCVYQQRNQCFLFRARRQAEHAHLVVANHALVLSDTVSGNRVLPPYERLIIDEAHHLEDQATTHFGFTVDERMIQEALDAVVHTEGAINSGVLPIASGFLTLDTASAASRRRSEAAELRSRSMQERLAHGRHHARDLFAALDGLLESGSGRAAYGRNVRLTSGLRAGTAWTAIEIAWDNLDQTLSSVETELRWFLDAVEAAEPEAGTPPDDPRMRQFDEVSSALISAARAVGDLAGQLSIAMNSSPDDMVTWLERSPIQGLLGLHAAPLRVDSVLQEQLFGRMRTAVLTSATMATDGSFAFIAERLGLEGAHEVVVPSPFDYARSTLLFLADDVVEPSHPRYQTQVHQSLIATCGATRGRTLVLFTSHAALQAAYRAIKEPLERVGIVVLAQRTDGSPRQLIERLRHSSGTVVLGTASFWEGIDVAGEALSLLVITKLPFAVPSDPVFAARGELIEDEGGHAFLDYAVPTAVLKFKQGFGRLIRSTQDRGVCAVLDRRVISKRYGQSFIESLPDCTLTIGSLDELPDAAARWIDG